MIDVWLTPSHIKYYRYKMPHIWSNKICKHFDSKTAVKNLVVAFNFHNKACWARRHADKLLNQSFNNKGQSFKGSAARHPSANHPYVNICSNRDNFRSYLIKKQRLYETSKINPQATVHGYWSYPIYFGTKYRWVMNIIGRSPFCEHWDVDHS